MGTRRAEVVIKLKTDGEAAARRALAGIVKESTKASQQMDRATAARVRNEGALERLAVRLKAQAEAAKTREALKSRKAQEKAERDATKARAKEEATRKALAGKAAAAEARNAEKQTAKARAEESKRTSDHDKALRDRLRLSERAFQQEMRAQQRGLREASRRAASERRSSAQLQTERRRGTQSDLALGDTLAQGTMGTVGALGAAIVGVGAQRNAQYAGWRNLEDTDAVIANYIEFRNHMLTVATNSGQDIEALQDLAERAAATRGINPEESAAALGVIQDVFADQFGAITSNWDKLTSVSAAFDAGLTGVTATGATMMQRFGIGEDQVDEAVSIAAASTGRGTVNLNQLSSEFGAVAPMLSGMFGQNVQGLRGAQQFSAFSQVSGKSGLSSASEQATATERFLAELADPATWDALARHGVNVTQGRGADRHLADPTQVMEAIAASFRGGGLHQAGALEDVFSSRPAQQYVRGLGGTGGIELYREMSALTPEAGNALTAQHLSNKANDEAWRARMATGARQGDLLNRGQDLLGQARSRSDYIEEFRTRHANTLGSSIPAAIAGGIEELTGLMDQIRPRSARTGDARIDARNENDWNIMHTPQQMARFYLGAPDAGGAGPVRGGGAMSFLDPLVNFLRGGGGTVEQRSASAASGAQVDLERGLASMQSALEAVRRTQESSTGRLIGSLDRAATAFSRSTPSTGRNEGEGK